MSSWYIGHHSTWILNMSMNTINRAIAIEILAGIYLVLTVTLFWRQPILATLLLSTGIGLWLWHYRNRADAAAMLWAAFLGTPSEMVLRQVPVLRHAKGYAVPWNAVAGCIAALIRTVHLGITPEFSRQFSSELVMRIYSYFAPRLFWILFPIPCLGPEK